MEAFGGSPETEKECVEMDKAALKPVKLTIRINGDGNYKDPISPFPHVYIQDALSQNILYHCYETPKTVEELARHCGVPAYYIEDCLQNLIYREAMSEISKGKYQTDFIIYSDKTNAYSDEAKGIFTPVIDRFVQSMKALADRTDALGIYTAGKAADERIYLYGLMALEHLSQQHNPVRCGSSGEIRRFPVELPCVPNIRYAIPDTCALAVSSRPTREAEGHINTYRIISADLHTVK